MIQGVRTLRGSLLRRLLWPLLALLLVSAGVEYWRASTRARQEQDHALQRVAIALASRLDLDADDVLDEDLGAHLDRTMAAMQRAAGDDVLAFMVRDPRGELLGGDAALQPLRDAQAQRDPVLADSVLAGRPVRVITYPHVSAIGAVTIVVAETTQRRHEQALRVLAETAATNLLLMALVLVLVRTGVVAGMRPLAELERSVSARASDDLSALPATRLPGELVPLVAAINGLMARLKDAAAQQQDFLSQAAHHLRTPLAGVQTQLELAAAATVDAAQRQRLEQVQAALRRITHTTHQMLALARSGPQALQAEAFCAVDLRELLEHAASEWLDTALALQVDLGFEARPALVHGSPWMLRELLGNLVANALRHSPPGWQVTVRCGARDAGSLAELDVEDQGPGIPVELRARVLERYYQAPGAAQGGSGLGLSIVHEVVQRHHGELLLQDGPGGRGLRVRVRLPVAAASSGN